ncbi:MAG: prepilin-type N-terminal cleavage/methylation domain-containing protein, partial [Cyanobacteriota bacterium]|nr:prepilin-type N-terminal cleavage/methylation domain-containing protein [Cyanobacteriota bacterium]
MFTIINIKNSIIHIKTDNKIGAFTLSELLIALGVIAILTAISMPIIHNLLPDQNVVMAKRAFYTT